MSRISDEVRAMLARANLAHLATVLPGGAPHSVPVWVDLDEGDRLLFFTQAGSRKARNLAADGRVALSVEDRDDPYEQCDVRGRVVRRLEGDAALEVADRLGVKYTGRPFPMRAPATVAYVVEIERAHHLKLPFSPG